MINISVTPEELVSINIVTDLHIFDKSAEGRLDFPKECHELGEKLYTIVDNSRVGATKSITILAGDVFERAMTKPSETIYWCIFFYKLSLITDIYVVLGNHETTYYHNNLFWNLVDYENSELLCNKFLFKHRVTTASPIFKIVEGLQINGFNIVFGHTGTKQYSNMIGRNILVTHNDILDPTIANIMKTKYKKDLFERHIDYQTITNLHLKEYFERVYVSHMHSCFGDFSDRLEDGRLFSIVYMADLSRRKKDEVNDLDRERIIPHIFIKGDNVNYTHTSLILPLAQDIFDESVLNKKAIEEMKEEPLNFYTYRKAFEGELIEGIYNSLKFEKDRINFICLLNNKLSPSISHSLETNKEVMSEFNERTSN